MNIPKTLGEEIARIQSDAAVASTPQLAMLAQVRVRYLKSFDWGVAQWTDNPAEAMLAEPGLAEVITNILSNDGVALRQLPITK